MRKLLEQVDLSETRTLAEAADLITDPTHTDPVSVRFEYDQGNKFEVVAVGDDVELAGLVGNRLGIPEPEINFKPETIVNGLFKALRKRSVAAPAALMIVRLQLAEGDHVGAEYQLPLLGTKTPNRLSYMVARYEVNNNKLDRKLVPEFSGAKVKVNSTYLDPERKQSDPNSFTTADDILATSLRNGRSGTT